MQKIFVCISLIEDIGGDSSLLESKRGEAERLIEVLGCCLRVSGVAGTAGFAFLAIFHIWTNVARTNVAWTNVTVTVGIC